MRNKQHITATIFDKKGNILSKGYNSYSKTHPLQYHYALKAGLPEKIYLHAEICSLTKLKYGIPYKIKIERYNRHGKPLDATPCPICQLALKEAGIKHIEATHG